MPRRKRWGFLLGAHPSESRCGRSQRPRHISAPQGVAVARATLDFTSAKFQPLRCQIDPSAYSTRLMTAFSWKAFPDLSARLSALTAPLGPEGLKACSSFSLPGLIWTPHRNCRRATFEGFDVSTNWYSQNRTSTAFAAAFRTLT